MPIISPKIPHGLEELMKGLAKSVIKENPDNIYEFAAEYFENLLRQRDGDDDQNYKKFATYRVYQKNRMERRKREKENVSNIDNKNGNLMRNKKIAAESGIDVCRMTSEFIEERDSIEKVTSNDSVQSQLQESQEIRHTSLESEINEIEVKQDSIVDDEGSPQKSICAENEDISGIVLDDEMASAALKIQSTFRGHKARQEMKVIYENEMIAHEKVSIAEFPSDNDNDNKNNIDDITCGQEIVITSNDNENLEFDPNDSSQILSLDADENFAVTEDGGETEFDDLEKYTTLKQISDEIAEENDIEINANSRSFDANDNELNVACEQNVEMEQENSVEDIIQENIQLLSAISVDVESDNTYIIVNDEKLQLEENQLEVLDAENLSIEKHEEDVSDMILDDEMEEAALKIQATFRGHKARKYVEQQQESVKNAANSSKENLDEESHSEVNDIIQNENDNEMKPQEDIVCASDEFEMSDKEENFNGKEMSNLDENNLLLSDTMIQDDQVENVELNTNSIDAEFVEHDLIGEELKDDTEVFENFDLMEETEQKEFEAETNGDVEKSLENVLSAEEIQIVKDESLTDINNSNELSEENPINTSDISENMLMKNEIEAAENESEGNNLDMTSTNIDEEFGEPLNPNKIIDTKGSLDEHSPGTDSKITDLKNNSLPENQEENIESEYILENILSANVSPYDLIDELVNNEANEFSLQYENIYKAVDEDQAALKIQSSFRGYKSRKEHKYIPAKKEHSILDIEPTELLLDKNVDDMEIIMNPELLDVREHDIEMSKDSFESKDEILNPEKEESEIPEENNGPFCETLYPEQDNCILDLDENLEPIFDKNEGEKEEEEDNSTNDLFKNEDTEVLDNISDELTEEVAHNLQKESFSNTTNNESLNQDDSVNSDTIVIEQCSEGNEETQDTQDNDENEQQDTSADVEEIQESESAEHENEETEEVTDEKEETENNDQDGDDPEEQDQNEGDSAVQEDNNNDEDDIANMVLDDEMEQAALKIQSTFRGHKSRNEGKSKQDESEASIKESMENVEDDIANMVLDEEMEQAALKIQSAFRGNKSKKETEENKEETEESTDQKDDSEDKKSEPTTSKESSEKTEKQLQDEEDIANLVMDDEMEKTALKIQSAFRGKIKRKTPKDGIESSETDEYSADTESSAQKSNEEASDIYEFFSKSLEFDDENDEKRNYYEDSEAYLINRDSYANEGQYSIQNDNAMNAYNQTIYPTEYDNDVDLMHGGGIFPEPSGESGTLESLSEHSCGDNNEDNNDPPKKITSIDLSIASFKYEESDSVEHQSEEKVIENFQFESKKDSAEAMYYSLKRKEIEAQKLFESNADSDDHPNNTLEGNDDDDVVVFKNSMMDTYQQKYGMSMDERLLGSILSHEYIHKQQKVYPDGMFDPMLEEAMSSNYNISDKMRQLSKSKDDKSIDYENVGEEDQFDDFFPGNIRSKMMASSISIADSDFFDPTNNKSIIDDDTIRTVLQTIHSSDSESTICSAATKIQASEKNFMTDRNRYPQYSSIGNAAIDKSLDDFIQSQELQIDRFDEEPEGYNSPPPKKQESIDDFTDDTCTESEKRPTMAGIIEIKLEQKNFLTIDERRRTLHREDAIQRNSTRSVDEDTSKSTNDSHEKVLDSNNSQSEAVVSTTLHPQNSITDTEINVPVLEKKAKPSANTKSKKFTIRRQKTMPVQIESSVIRVLPRNLRSRVRSAESDKNKRSHK